MYNKMVFFTMVHNISDQWHADRPSGVCAALPLDNEKK